MQGYLAAAGTVDGLIDDAELDWRTERQARFAAQNVLDALAPTNFPWSNPTVLKELVDRGGANLVRGVRQLGRDLSRPPRLPASVDVSKFEVGGNLAVTPGAVVLRNEVLELIQYQPQTAEVRAVPLLVVPPTINKYYIVDLAPGRSIVEWLVGQGQQVFTISWRNPDPEQGHFDLDTYAEAVADARGAVAAVTGQESVHALGACSGGMITARPVGLAGGRRPAVGVRERDADGVRARQRARGHEPPRSARATSPRRRWRSRRARATSTVARWRRSSPGSGRTT